MLIDNNNVWDAPVRRIEARVELLNGSTLVETFTPNDRLKSFTIERVGDENKFFGFGVCQKTNIHLIDKDRELEITTANSFNNFLGTSKNMVRCTPNFYVTEVHRNENNNELSITAYDAIYKAIEHTVAELELQPPYTIKNVMETVAAFLGLAGVSFTGFNRNEGWTTRVYEEGANLEGTENLRTVLDALAEATQSVYYINRSNYLIFKRMEAANDAVLTIGKEDYITLESKTNRRLCAVVSATELGDNVGTSLEATGTTQYVRNNPFWELREDIDTIVEEALAAVGGFTINQFSCKWRGNYTLEIGDKINLITKDNDVVSSYIINDVITFDGGLTQDTKWNYTEQEAEHSNPSTLGEVLKQTYAKVDKINKEVEIVVDETAALRMNAESINFSITTLNNEVSQKADSNEVAAAIQEQLAEGANKVVTTIGSFDNKGFRVSKSDSEISTIITEDGMRIEKANDTVLTADNQGVKAIDLHATTYLIIGKNSRFEDYAGSRTACIWIG